MGVGLPGYGIIGERVPFPRKGVPSDERRSLRSQLKEGPKVSYDLSPLK